MQKKSIILNPWTIAIIVPIISGVITNFIIQYFSTFSLFDFLLNFLITILFAKLSVWIILCLLILSVITYYIIKVKQKELTEQDYNKDKFDGIVWVWSKRRYRDELFKLEAQCPDCRTPLVFLKSPFGFFCTTCNNQYNLPKWVIEHNYKSYLNKLELKIFGLYNSGEWKGRITKRYLKNNGLI